VTSDLQSPVVLARLLVALSLLIAVGLASPAPAPANSPVAQFSATPSGTQAGGHPDVNVKFTVQNRFELPPNECGCSDPKDVAISTPPGLVGDPHSIPECVDTDFLQLKCPVDSQVGLAEFGLGLVPVYNLAPHPGQAGLFGIFIPLVAIPIFEVVSSRTQSDYGLTFTVFGATQILPIPPFNQEFWGVPGDARHDVERFPFERSACFQHLSPEGANLGAAGCSDNGVPWGPEHFNAAVKPFIEAPTTCGEPLIASIDVLSYDHGTSHADFPWPATTGCDQLSFNPSLFAQPTTQSTDSASGADIDLQVPQLTSPSVPSPSEIRAATVTLPPGFSINPNAADGKTVCSDSEANFGTPDEAHCPEFAKVATLTLTSTLLPGPLPGAVYLGQPLPGNRYRIFLTADGFATHVKLEGTINPDPRTGQLTITFSNLPQTPFEDFNLHFFGSERGLLATPTQCGTYPVTSTFTPWDQALPDHTSTQYFNLIAGPSGQPCPGVQRPFDPQFRAGVTDNTAGVHSPFTLELSRSDGEQNLTAVNVSTPPGFSAKIAGVPYCSDAALAAAASPSYSGLTELAFPSCPPASRIGTASATAGAGNHPVHIPGQVYLAGPYEGAPLSLVVITPAVSGPYDLGNVLVRTAIQVDPTDAHVTAVSDPLPQILEGVPLRLRSIRISLDRPNFALNPTNCQPFSVGASLDGDQGSTAMRASHFQVANCANLPYRPTLDLRLTGGMRRRGHPAVHAMLNAGRGEANTRRVVVILPKGELLDNAHIENVCSKVEFAKGACPAGSTIGNAEVKTPLLDQPLEGPVLLRSSEHKLPDLVIDLKGQIDIELVGRVDSVNASMRTTFESVPDAPVSQFKLNLEGGSKGLLQNSESLCGTAKQATVRMVGQNGIALNAKSALQSSCDSKPRHARHHGRQEGRGR
jgi:hypothetical protein